MAYTQAQLDALRAAIARGEHGYSVQFGSRMVRRRFRSLEEMLRLERIMSAEVEGGSNTTTTLASFSRE